jgi:hypothetical protein
MPQFGFLRYYFPSPPLPSFTSLLFLFYFNLTMCFTIFCSFDFPPIPSFYSRKDAPISSQPHVSLFPHNLVSSTPPSISLCLIFLFIFYIAQRCNRTAAALRKFFMLVAVIRSLPRPSFPLSYHLFILPNGPFVPCNFPLLSSLLPPRDFLIEPISVEDAAQKHWRWSIQKTCAGSMRATSSLFLTFFNYFLKL